MRIWVDADACPKAIKDIVCRAALRTETLAIFVANQWLALPSSPFIQKVQVSQGFDMADNYIVQNIQTGELTITADIPLAAAVVAHGSLALNPRGEMYNNENIGQLLSIRNFTSDLRDAGLITGGPAKQSPKDVQAFANRLDQWLAKQA
jgi:uncharacterized protein YaiI (UPF0178 family)